MAGKEKTPTEDRTEIDTESEMDKAVEDSMDASDPPSFTPGKAGTPDKKKDGGENGGG